MSFAIFVGVFCYLVVRIAFFGFVTLDQNVRGVKTRFGRAIRINENQGSSSLPIAESLNTEEKLRYNYPLLAVIGPGLHFKMPWEKIHKVSVATDTINMAFDIESPSSNSNGTLLEAVTRDQLNIGLKGQIRFRVSEQNLYAYFFGIKSPIVHVMGFFVSLLRERIACYENPNAGDPKPAKEETGIHISETVSINDLRKNLRDLNESMIKECQSSEARYGIVLDASLITGIEPPHEVESALAAINTAYNNVSSEISVAKATADQTIVQSKRAVEIETLKVQTEVEPLMALAREIQELKKSGPEVLRSYVRNARLKLFQKAKTIVLENTNGGAK